MWSGIVTAEAAEIGMMPPPSHTTASANPGDDRPSRMVVSRVQPQPAGFELPLAERGIIVSYLTVVTRQLVSVTPGQKCNFTDGRQDVLVA